MSAKLSFTQRFNQHAFLWVLVLLLGLIFQTAQATGTQRELLSNSPVPAAADSFWDTDMRLCDVDEEGKCHTSDYALSVARFGFGGVIAAFLSLLSFIIFLPVRCLCNGFGGKNTSEGFCPSTSDKRDYTSSEILTVKIIAGIVVIPIIIGVAIGFKSNSDISASIDDITASLVESGDNIMNSLILVRDVLISLPITAPGSFRPILNDAVDTATEISKNLHDAQDLADRYDRLRETLMIVGFAFTLVLVLTGIGSAIFNLRFLALLLGVVSLLSLTILWLSFGIHLVAGKFVYDVCVDIDILTANSTDSSNSTSIFKTGALANLWQCDNNTDFASLRQLVDDARTVAADAACEARSQLCFDPVDGSGFPDWVCSTTPPCNRDTLVVVTDGNHMVIMDNGVNRTLFECAVNCTNANYKNASLVLSGGVSVYANYTNLYDTVILPIVSCQLAEDVLLNVREPLCEDMFDALYGVAVSNLVMGIFYVPFIVLMVIGYKRFQSLNGGIV